MASNESLESNPPILKVMKNHPLAVIPTRATPMSAGLDLYSAYNYYISPGKQVLINTEIKLEIPPGHYGRVASRSGLALNNYLHAGAGVIDPDYRGPIYVLLTNLGPTVQVIAPRARIAQLILEKMSIPVVQEVHTLTATSRAEHAFGSTGSFYSPFII